VYGWAQSPITKWLYSVITLIPKTSLIDLGTENDIIKFQQIFGVRYLEFPGRYSAFTHADSSCVGRAICDVYASVCLYVCQLVFLYDIS